MTEIWIFGWIGVLWFRQRHVIRNKDDKISELGKALDEKTALYEKLIDQVAANQVAAMPLSRIRPALAKAVEFTKRFETDPVGPENTAAVCEMVCEHLYQILNGFTDEHRATAILSCCSALEQLRALAEQDAETLDAAVKAMTELAGDEE